MDRWTGKAVNAHHRHDLCADCASPKGWDYCCQWADVLSLGEQQRIGVARMLFHEPKFGLLDECTSAVSIDQEEELHAATHRAGITCVTVSQNMTLPELHTQELRIGVDNECGWEMVDVDLDQKNQVASSV